MDNRSGVTKARQPASTRTKAKPTQVKERKTTQKEMALDTDATDAAAFFLAHGTDGLERPGQPGHHRLPDGRLILPLMLDLPRICLYRRCRRAKTCTQDDMPCAIDFHIGLAEQRWNRLEKSLAWRTRRWERVAGPNAPRVPR